MKLNISFAVGTLNSVPVSEGRWDSFSCVRKVRKKKKGGMKFNHTIFCKFQWQLQKFSNLVVCDQTHTSDQKGTNYGRHCCKTSCLWCSTTDILPKEHGVRCHIIEETVSEVALVEKWKSFHFVTCKKKDAEKESAKKKKKKSHYTTITLALSLAGHLTKKCFSHDSKPKRLKRSECTEHPHCPTSFNWCKLTMWCAQNQITFAWPKVPASSPCAAGRWDLASRAEDCSQTRNW